MTPFKIGQRDRDQEDHVKSQPQANSSGDLISKIPNT
jgi:hypothetical protein